MPKDAIQLKIDGRKLTDDRFEKAIVAFFDLIRSVTDNLLAEEGSVRWIIEVEHGSAIIRARPEGDAEEQAAAMESLDYICDGVRSLSRGAILKPQYFTDVSLRAARTMASIQDVEGEFVSSVTIQNGADPIELTPQTISSVDSLLGAEYEAIGSVEGKIQTISERKGFKLAVYDSIHDEPVICYPANKKVSDDGMRAFGERVIVSGRVRYGKNGRPSSVVAESIRVFPKENELPTLQDVQRIYSSI